MANYIKNNLDEKHLVSTSFVGTPVYFDGLDLADMHAYSNKRDLILDVMAPLTEANFSVNHKPWVTGEIGLNGGDDFEACSPITLHNRLWSTSFTGTIGSYIPWFWNVYHRPDLRYFEEFQPLADFVAGVDFEWNNFTPFHGTAFTLPTDFALQDDKIEYFYLKNLPVDETTTSQIMGWVHNMSAYWASVVGCSYFEDTDNDGNIEQYFCPNDDANCPGYITTVPESVLKFDGLDADATYYYQYYNTTTGEYIDNPEVLTVFPAGVGILLLPLFDDANDYAFKIWQAPGFRSITAQDTITLNICSNTGLNALSFLWNNPEDVLRINGKTIDTNYVLANRGTYSLNVISEQDTFKYKIVVSDCVKDSLDTLLAYNNPSLINQQKENVSDNTPINSNLSFVIYPNPASGYLIIETIGNTRKYECEISDIAGNLLFKNNFSGYRNEINTSIYSRGTYIMSLKLADNIYHQKIILQ